MILLTVATLVTSIVSGVLGMAGGMILMGVFGFFLSVPAAMALHGIAQAFSNGSRVWLYRRRLKWRVLVFYTAGALPVPVVFALLTLVPGTALVFILIGLFPYIALLLPESVRLDMERGRVAFAAGILVTTAQMLAGASGPVLDIFYVQSRMSKEAVLGTKAVTQTLGHVLKLAYYASVMAAAGANLSPWLFPAVAGAAVAGNYLGSLVVAGMSDRQFRRAGRYVILVIGFVYIVKGMTELWQPR